MFRKLEPAPDYEVPQLEELANSMVDSSAAPAGGWGSEQQPGADNPSIPAAYTYLGQFVDHDITFDPVSSLQAKNDPDALVDFRSPRFDLDSLYGSGPQDEPFQYLKSDDSHKFLIEPNDRGELDLPRTSQGIAIIGDPRNDENIIVSQLQLVFLKLHDKLVDQEAAAGTSAERVFSEAQRLTRWHYQWVVVHDFLPRICGPHLGQFLPEGWGQPPPEANSGGAIATSGGTKRRWYTPKNNAYMPVEFSVAAYRFGHSQIRPAYDLNATVTERPIFLPGDVGELDDLRGGRPLPGQWTIDWSRFAEVGGSQPQLSRLIDTKLTPGLFNLPGSERSLALRNLMRGQALSLPSGQDVATALGLPVRTPEELGAALVPTPLWFYVLKESELEGGQHLGAVGAAIVAEVLLGLLELDPMSFINQNPLWRPTIGDTEGLLTLADLIVFATS